MQTATESPRLSGVVRRLLESLERCFTTLRHGDADVVPVAVRRDLRPVGPAPRREAVGGAVRTYGPSSAATLRANERTRDRLRTAGEPVPHAPRVEDSNTDA